MKKIFFAAIVLLLNFSALPQASNAQTKVEDTDVKAARKARDNASIEELQKIVAKTKKEADEKNSPEGYLRLALFYSWLLEAIEDRQEKKLFKPTAEEGVTAAEKAVALNPKSSEAHYLLGDLLNQLIPHVYGGGMKFGRRAEDELNKAIELDPKNVNAYVSRAITYYYTPEAFGGSRTKAFEMLKKAVEINSQEDAPHIWLAMFYLDANQKKEAMNEILLARKINPDRAFTNYVYEMVKNGDEKKDAGKNLPAKRTN